MTIETLHQVFPSLTADQYQLLQKFLTIFLEKNTQINLSAIRDEQGVWEKHLYDSLAGSSFIEHHQPKKILDMGTGGGFPTLPLNICFPEIQFFPVDSVQKKLKCVAEFAKQLDIKTVNPLAGRAEDLANRKEYREKFSMVVTRAFAKFSPLLEMTTPFLQDNGVLLAYRGPENDMENDEDLIEYFGCILTDIKTYELPNGDQREIWEITKREKTPKKFPRMVGLPKKEPVKV